MKAASSQKHGSDLQQCGLEASALKASQAVKVQAKKETASADKRRGGCAIQNTLIESSKAGKINTFRRLTSQSALSNAYDCGENQLVSRRWSISKCIHGWFPTVPRCKSAPSPFGRSPMRFTFMRMVAFAAVFAAWHTFSGKAAAQVPPCHLVNKHLPFWTRSCCTCCSQYRSFGLYGMHDAFPLFPPGPVMPPPIPPRYLGNPAGGNGTGQGQMWFRSPRDFYMMPGY